MTRNAFRVEPNDVSVLAWTSTSSAWSTETEAWELVPDESSPEAVQSIPDWNDAPDAADQSLSTADVAVFAVGPKLIEESDPRIAVGLVRPQNGSSALARR